MAVRIIYAFSVSTFNHRRFGETTISYIPAGAAMYNSGMGNYPFFPLNSQGTFH
jgi:hypothetical protein